MSHSVHDGDPLSLTRRIEDFPIANRPLSALSRAVAEAHGLHADPMAWLESVDLTDFMASGAAVLTDGLGVPLAWRGLHPDREDRFAGAHSFLVRYPWDLLRANEQYVSAMVENQIEGDVHASVVVDGVIHLGKGSQLLPGVLIEGNVVIGCGCKIGPNCYIRGHTSIGDHCRIGQAVEVKNSLILSHTHIGHLSYVGDSVIGEHVNLGAGTITSNFRHDGKMHRSLVSGVLIDTGRKKFGAVIGDGVRTGIHTSIYPGRKLWPGVTTLPGEMVRTDRLGDD